ncbi:hypothetical protein CMI47_21630 [Candidatus Pacearchaeota archaeon]|nr:hypothetical protein [Candidatus Pacearchaeota archaeon]|tara:strand:- start:922 stop:1161 length:240 start_codon:yes stop_codon:yes gene_type:complete
MNTHDYSAREWGRNYNILGTEDEGLSIRIAGWGGGISNNDYIILKNGNDTTRYQIENIEYKRDPPDMWFASATFSPRES